MKQTLDHIATKYGKERTKGRNTNFLCLLRFPPNLRYLPLSDIELAAEKTLQYSAVPIFFCQMHFFVTLALRPESSFYPVRLLGPLPGATRYGLGFEIWGK